jgi:hypothetical protein
MSIEIIEKPKEAWVLYRYYRNPKNQKAEAEAPEVIAVTDDDEIAKRWERREQEEGYSFYTGKVPVFG